MQFVTAEQMTSANVSAVNAWYAGAFDGRWPCREAFRPEALPGWVLPKVGLVDVETDPLRVFYRVLGEDICASIGRSIRMAYLDTLELPQEAELLALYRRALESPDPLFLKGQQALDGRSIGYEGACFPLGEAVDSPRRFVIVEDYLDTEAWREALRWRHYRIDGR